MEKYLDINEEGLSVRCKLYYNDKKARTFPHVVLAMHGFGGNKENKFTEKLGDRLTSKYKGFAVLAFDWPCHGADARKKLVFSEFLQYLQLAIDYAQKELQAQTIDVYATSFGCYVTLRYLHDIGCPFRRIVLRSAATHMHETMLRNIDDDDKKKLSKGKEIMVGYERKMKLDQKFLDDLKNGDIRNYEYFDYADNMMMLHGLKDKLVDWHDSEEFAENNVITFIPVENADHTFSGQQASDFAVHEIVKFFAPDDD